MNGLRHVGWIWALYVKDSFIEYFATPEYAKSFAKKYYPNLEVFIKPVAYYLYQEDETK